MSTTLGKRIRDMRKAKGLNQTALAKLAGISQGSISWIEKGETRLLRADTLLALAKALSVNVDFLRDGTATPVPPETLSLEESELIVLFREMPPIQQDALLAQARAIHELLSKAPTRIAPYKVAPKQRA